MNDWIRVIDELPVIPEGRHSVPVIVATFDPCFDEMSGNGYSTTHGIYGKEYFSQKNDFLSLEPDYCKETAWIPFLDTVTHWMYEHEPPAYDPESLNPIFKWYHENAKPQPPLKVI